MFIEDRKTSIVFIGHKAFFNFHFFYRKNPLLLRLHRAHRRKMLVVKLPQTLQQKWIVLKLVQCVIKVRLKRLRLKNHINLSLPFIILSSVISLVHLCTEVIILRTLETLTRQPSENVTDFK